MKKFFYRIDKFFRDINAEVRKVVWPTRSQLVNNTAVVLMCILIVGVVIWVLDALFASGVSFVIPPTTPAG